VTIAGWCVLIAGLMPYVLVGLAKSRRDFDNARPRAWLAEVGGWRQRAQWAQLNSFEAFPFFVAGVVIAQQADAPQGWVDGLAVAFIAARLAYSTFYIVDRPGWRSVAWSCGIALVIGLFVAAAIP